jgi:hypothetical protein
MRARDGLDPRAAGALGLEPPLQLLRLVARGDVDRGAVQPQRPVGVDDLARAAEDPRLRAVGAPHAVLRHDDRPVGGRREHDRVDTLAVLRVHQVVPAPLRLGPDEVARVIARDHLRLVADDLDLERRLQTGPEDHPQHGADKRLELRRPVTGHAALSHRSPG